MIERPDPDALLAGPLGEWLTSQQALRTETQRKVVTRSTITVIIAVIVILVHAIGSYLLFGGWPSMPLVTTIFIGAMGWLWVRSATTPVIRSIKAGLNGAVAQALGLKFDLAAQPGPEWDRANAFKMLPSHDEKKLEDCWSGELGSLPFRLYEAHLRRWEGVGKERRLRTVFQGVVINVRFTRRFQGATVIEQQDRHTSWFGGEKDTVELGGLQLQRCEMVNPQFEDLLTVWGSDPVEAHYLVHPNYIERMIAVERAFRGADIRALFMEGDLLIVFKTENLFESGTLDATVDRAMLEQTIEQFTTLADLAQRLNEAPRGPVS